MINLAVAEFLFALILLIVAYLISHTINGYIQSYVCSKLGDDSAKDAGLMTFNPLMHIDLFGFLALIFLGIGWLQTVPIDPAAFQGKIPIPKIILCLCNRGIGKHHYCSGIIISGRVFFWLSFN